MPALLFSALSASQLNAAQFSDYASPPPTPITQAPSRDFATEPSSASKPEPAPARYAPPVHVAPAKAGDFNARASQAIFEGQSVNGRRNVMQQVSYSARPTVAKLSDDSLGRQHAGSPVYQAEPPVSAPVESSIAAQNVGLHGYQRPTRAITAQNHQPQVRTRRPGLQDRISLALQRQSEKRGEPTPAEPVPQIQEQVSVVETVAYQRPERSGRPERSTQSRGSRSYRQRLVDAEASRRSRSNEVEIELAENGDRGQWQTDVQRQPVRENREVAVADYYDREDERLVEFATDERDVDFVDEEIQPVARLAEVNEAVRPPKIARARPQTYDRSRSQKTRGRQVSVLSRQDKEGNAGSATKQLPSRTSPGNDFGGFGSDSPSTARSRRSVEMVEDFDPLDDFPGEPLDDEDDVSDRDDDMEDLDDLDEDIDSELARLRKESDRDSDDDDDTVSRPDAKDCETFRNELLNSSIREIALDISPPASSLPGSAYPIARTWIDHHGNVLGTGAMRDLRRGYVILDSGQKIAYAKLSESDWAAVSEFWRLPTVCSVGNRGSVERCWIPQTFTWTASNLCHKTLFFENVQLERYGHSHGPFTQPVQSVAHFFVSLVTVPYQAAIHPANECQYALGYYRPGNCAPWLKDPIPISLDGARRQALFVTGAAFLP